VLRALLVAALLACLAGAPAAAADRWGGLTRSEALTRARADLVAWHIAADGATPAQAARLSRYLRVTPAKTAHYTCFNKVRAWRITWPKIDPVYIGRRGLLLAC